MQPRRAAQTEPGAVPSISAAVAPIPERTFAERRALRCRSPDAEAAQLAEWTQLQIGAQKRVEHPAENRTVSPGKPRVRY